MSNVKFLLYFKLQIGHNSLTIEGALDLIESLEQNENTGLKFLDLSVSELKKVYIGTSTISTSGL